ncbi:MAG TPA: hypothetical protein VLA83_16715 [Candidatus Binatia bacterium]|nr:hypothetical protein [Candidatus Binatia bacterium]
MTPYIRNRNCQCTRCRAHGLMGAAVLITLGVLFLLDSYGVVRFNETFPILFLVIGGVLLVSHTGSTEGHIQPGWTQGYVAQPPVQPVTTTTTAPPPPQPQQSAYSADNPPPASGQDDSQVKP